MPVRKFRSVEAMGDADLDWLPAGSEELWRAIRSVWARARAHSPWHPVPGVHRFRTMEDANAQRAEWEQACVEAAARRIIGGEPRDHAETDT